jgi:peptidoglycan/LPS O-acetylase OafA/YrhL
MGSEEVSASSRQISLPPPDPHNNRSLRLDALTSLRFFAAIYVVAFHVGKTDAVPHAPAVSWRLFLNHGYFAVSFFFILSGFLLTRIYRDEWRAGNYGHFIVARFARIYPVYLLALAIQAPFYYPLAHMHKTIAVALMVQSWTVLPSEYPGAWNFPAWTLSVEWFFYVSFPVLLWLLAKVQRKWLVIAVILIASIAIDGPQAAIGARLTWFSRHIPLPLLRLPEFFLGMLVATVEPHRPLKSRHWSAAVILLTVLLLSLNIHRFVTLVVVAFAAMIWLLAYEDSAIRRWFETPSLVLLGGASYAIYILQDPIRSWLMLWSETWLQLPMIERAGYPVALIAISVAVFLWFEQPTRRWLRSSPTPAICVLNLQLMEEPAESE